MKLCVSGTTKAEREQRGGSRGNPGPHRVFSSIIPICFFALPQGRIRAAHFRSDPESLFGRTSRNSSERRAPPGHQSPSGWSFPRKPSDRECQAGSPEHCATDSTAISSQPRRFTIAQIQRAEARVGCKPGSRPVQNEVVRFVVVAVAQAIFVGA